MVADLDSLEHRLDGARPRISRLTPGDAALLYDVFADDLADVRKAVEAMPEGGEKLAARARASFVGDRFAPARVKVESPGGLPSAGLDDVSRGTKRDPRDAWCWWVGTAPPPHDTVPPLYAPTVSAARPRSRRLRM